MRTGRTTLRSGGGGSTLKRMKYLLSDDRTFMQRPLCRSPIRHRRAARLVEARHSTRVVNTAGISSNLPLLF